MPTIDEIAYVYNALPTASVILKTDSPHFTIVTANSAFLKSTHTNLPELIGKGFFEVFPMNPDDSGVRTRTMRNAFEHVLKTGESFQIKSHNYNIPSSVHHALSVRFWKIDAYPLLDYSGEVEYIVQSSEDITYLKEEEERTKLAQQRDFDLFNFSPVPMWAYDTRTLQILAANDAAQKDYGYSLAEFLCLTVKELWPEEDVPAMMKMVEQKVKYGLRNKAVVRHIKKNGTVIYVDIESKPVLSWGENTRIITALDITSSKILNELESHEKRVLELNSKPAVPLTEVLAYYVQGIESLFPEMQCTIMKVKYNRIYSWVSSSLPKVYMDGIEGLLIGDNVGSCGTAAFLKQTVIVTDINYDPRWSGYQELALSNNLFACWSQPIVNSKGEVMATFAMYYSKVKEPNENELKVIERASSLLKIILENRAYAESLNESHLLIKAHLDRYSAVSKATSDAIWDYNILTGEVIWNNAIKEIFGYDKVEGKYQWWYRHVHPDDLQKITDIVKLNILEKRSRWFCEYRFRCADGSYKFVLDRGFLMFDEDGRAIRMIGAMQDITERISYIHTMEEHNLRLRDIAWAQTHLVRAPLARILGIIELLEATNGKITDKELLDYLSISAKELDEVIKGIIDKSLN